MNTALVVMAAGIGSRFGGGIKQLEAVGPNGEIIMDYSIHDAIEAGFNKIIFIIRKDIEEAFKEAIGNRIEKICGRLDVEIQYAYQDLDQLPEGITRPKGRTKPWGTGQAVLSCKGMIQEPFVVINADDYYGKEAFVKIHEFLSGYTPARAANLCMAGFVLGNTLSENGSVTRGVCSVDTKGYLAEVVETYNIVKTENGAKSGENTIDTNSIVSMNMWGLTSEFVDLLEEGFVDFFREIMGDEEKEQKAEYLLPTYIDRLLRKGKMSVKVLQTQDRWFGVTYKEDKPVVVESFAKLIADGVYQNDLFGDL